MALLVGIFTILTGQLVSAQLVDDGDLGSLKTVPVPEPSNLYQFVKSKPDAIALGKALFWDMQVAVHKAQGFGIQKAGDSLSETRCVSELPQAISRQAKLI